MIVDYTCHDERQFDAIKAWSRPTVPRGPLDDPVPGTTPTGDTAARYLANMAMFEFELYPVGEIETWGASEKPSLSWFALTYGWFRLNVGEQTLFEYSPAIRRHWGPDGSAAISPEDVPGLHRLTGLVDYQIAAIARDVLDAAQHGMEQIPASMVDFVGDRAAVDDLLRRTTGASEDASYNAWRWLGQRSISAAYFLAHPMVWFVRLDDQLCVRWDNRERVVDGIPVWTATRGEFTIPLSAFQAECTDFKDRLLMAMERRIDGIASGDAPAAIPLDAQSLRQQQETWRNEFAGDLRPVGPDVPWDVTEKALRELAAIAALPWPARAS